MAERRAFFPTEYAQHHTGNFAKRVLDEGFFHEWWIRPQYNIIDPQHAALNILSCQRGTLVLDRAGNPTKAGIFELLVRDTGPGEYCIKVPVYPHFGATKKGGERENDR